MNSHFISRLLVFFTLLVSTIACVPNRKIQYLQNDLDKTKRSKIPVDSILNQYITVDYVYKLQHEDVLSIQISSLTPKEYDFFSQGLSQGNANVNMARSSGAISGYLIDKEGNIEFPVVGKVHFAGLTIYQAEDSVKKIAEEYLEEPVVKVRLLNFRYVVLGETGEKVVNTYQNRISLPEALGLAGGVGEMADRSKIKILRQNENQVSVLYVDMLDEQFIESPYYYIMPNDVIVVPPLKQRSFRNYWTQNIGIIVSTLSLLLLVVNTIDRFN